MILGDTHLMTIRMLSSPKCSPITDDESKRQENVAGKMKLKTCKVLECLGKRLHLLQLFVKAFIGHQLFMGAAFNDFSFLDNHNFIGMLDG